ncbi:flavodoxin domain-containing protein [Salirhabdus salicampi]|uniref:flavodoxin domain-containing protein n=1 Tax=Salirhabdus salicampi TaxID=476102 RepID=UPI0020C2E0D0|nr:flavodoxin domain-containing protein [Salirhabdus salicampi]MCP8616204.1 flavodoxin domain-containing protein [Salirhabdus salicampi]
MKVALIYTSITGNTKELVNILSYFFQSDYQIEPDLYLVHDFPQSRLAEYDAVVIATYSWGNGQIPREMIPLYMAFEQQNVKRLVTGVAGTGDTFYPHFCGAVDKFRDMLYVHTKLQVTLKIELLPQTKDLERCRLFVEKVMDTK